MSIKATLSLMLFGCLFIGFGFINFYEWLFHQSIVISVLPHHIHMIFNAGICFVMAGLTLFLAKHYSSPKKWILTVGGGCIFLWAGLSFSHDIFGYALRIDPLFMKVELIVPVLIFLVAITIGIGLLYWQFLPPIRDLILSKRAALESQLRLNNIMDHVAEGIMTTDAKGCIESVNFKFCEMYGYTKEEIVGQDIKKLMPSSVSATHDQKLAHYLETGESKMIGKAHVEVVGVRKCGESFPLQISITEMEIHGKRKFVALMRDITTSKAAEAALIESEKRFQLAFQDASIGMAIVSLEGRWLKVNSALCALIGYSEEELLKIDFQTITHPADLEADLNHVKDLVNDKIKTYKMKKRYFHKNGNVIWILLSVSLIRDTENKPLYFIAQIQDITKEKRAKDQLKQLAYNDSLTGLANRRTLNSRLNQAMADAERNQNCMAMFYLDLDNFKTINDTLGHDVGDKLLIAVSQRITHITRKSDIVSRIGGDEFIIVFTNIGEYKIIAYLAERMIQTLAEKIKIAGHNLQITISIGISIYPNDAENAADLMKHADSALYQAKKAGRNNFQFYHAGPDFNSTPYLHEAD